MRTSCNFILFVEYFERVTLLAAYAVYQEALYIKHIKHKYKNLQKWTCKNNGNIKDAIKHIAYNFGPVSIIIPNMNLVHHRVWKKWGPLNFNAEL